jgi:hypothetical protein
MPANCMIIEALEQDNLPGRLLSELHLDRAVAFVVCSSNLSFRDYFRGNECD